VKLTIHLYTVLRLRMSGALLPLLYAFMVYPGTTLSSQFMYWYCKWPLPFKLSVQCLVRISHLCHICLHGIGWGANGNFSHDRCQLQFVNGEGLVSGISSDLMWWKRSPYFHQLQNPDSFSSFFPPSPAPHTHNSRVILLVLR